MFEHKRGSVKFIAFLHWNKQKRLKVYACLDYPTFIPAGYLRSTWGIFGGGWAWKIGAQGNWKLTDVVIFLLVLKFRYYFLIVEKDHEHN